MALSTSTWEVLEFFGTSGFAVALNQLLQGQLGETLKKGLDEFRTRVEKYAEYRVVVRGYIEHDVSDPYRSALQKKHADARVAGDLGRANRIEDAYVLVYLTFEDEILGNEQERKQMRLREFEDLGRAAMDPDPTRFDTMLEFYEQRGLRTYLLIAKQIGIDAWQFLGGPLTAIAEAIGGEGALERAKAYIQDPKRWGPDFLANRKEVREWAEKKTIDMERAYTVSMRMAERRKQENPDHWIRNVALSVGLTILGALALGLLYKLLG